MIFAYSQRKAIAACSQLPFLFSRAALLSFFGEYGHIFAPGSSRSIIIAVKIARALFDLKLWLS